MTNFRTEVQIKHASEEISHDKNILLVGSCFSDNIGNKLHESKFSVTMNPFGVLYNPVSVANGVDFIIQKKEFGRSDLEWYNGLWHSFYHHGSFSHKDPDRCLEKINQAINASHLQLKSASHLFITFGTSWVFERISNGKIVSNCHKLPAREFHRYALSAQEIKSTCQQMIHHLRKYNPDVHIVFTVSPIRHWKDGPVENQRSKATLITAIADLIKDDASIEYFPSYEIMMDDLRDYRFYDEDMLHPNKIAVNYIWKKFVEAFVSDESLTIISETEKVIKAAHHKPFNASSPEHQKFVKITLKKIRQLEEEYPYLSFDKEIAVLNEQLI